MTTPSDLPLVRLADPRWVDSANDHDFEAHVLILLNNPRATVPECLLEPDRVERFAATLNLHRTQAEGILSEMRAEHAAMQQNCFAQGPAGKKRWFNFEADWKMRRREHVERKKNAEIHLQRAKLKRSGSREATSARDRDTRHALEILAKAIAEHRESMEWSGNESTVSDRALWASMNRARVPNGRDGSITVREWLARISDARESSGF
ncbi:hypothetical protein [Rhodococcus koreensis]|uniref:hypothetical protein n=1 Tax=Rhodococcus koreensis TaxID=99653 RepID=UPI0036D8C1C4